MFGTLTDKFEGVFRRLRGLGKISESNVADALRDVRLALLEADVDFGVTRDFLAAVKEKALGAEVLKSVTPGQQLVKIFHDEITALLGGDAVPLDLTPPARIMMVGLNGAGKTTTSAKLALKLKKEGKKPVLIALDLYRPAAIDQLATLAGEVGVPIYRPEPGEKNVLKAAKAAEAWIATQKADVIIFDTAGRQEVDEALLAELKEIRKYLAPKEVLLVADAATGQQAVSVAKTFHEAIGITGIVLTKLDGDARGGAALSMRRVTQQPIKYAGVGEKMNQLDVFVPDRMAQRILGMGDIVGLVEQAAEAIDEADAMKMMERMTSSDFDFNDFLGQLKMMKKLTSGAGGMMGLLSLLPGVGGKIKEMKSQVDDKKLNHIEALILSMTPKERKRPEILNAKRRARIAAGAGRSVNELNGMLQQFGDMRKLMKNPGKMGQMAKMMGGMGGGGGMGGLGGLGGMGGGGMPDFSKLGGMPGMGGGKHSGGSKFGQMGKPGGGGKRKR
jgi:signal recognition particle subunit SRP54